MGSKNSSNAKKYDGILEESFIESEPDLSISMNSKSFT